MIRILKGMVITLALIIVPPAEPSQKGIYVPAFAAPQELALLGLNASTVVNLAIWKTLRRSPFPNPDHLSFGDGIVRWSEEPPAGTDYSQMARETGVQLILTGSAFPYGSGAVVTTRLQITAPTQEDVGSQTWKIGIPITNGELTYSQLDVIPERSVTFKALALTGADLKAFESPGLLEVHQGGVTGRVIGRVGDNFRALEQSSTFAMISTDTGLRGYLKLPGEPAESAAIAEFSGGVLRLLRNDWSGAVGLFSRFASNPAALTSAVVDAKLMSAYCLERKGMDGRIVIEEAAQISSTAPRVLKYRVMVLLAEITRRENSDEHTAIPALTLSLRRAIREAAAALGNNDPWLREIAAAEDRLTGSK